MPQSGKERQARDVYIAPEAPEETKIGWRMAGMGFQVVSEVAAGALLGWLFDKWRGTAPKGVMVGSIVGIVVGLWSLIRNALKLNRELEQNAPVRNRRTFPTASSEDQQADSSEGDWDKDDWNNDDWPKADRNDANNHRKPE